MPLPRLAPTPAEVAGAGAAGTGVAWAGPAAALERCRRLVEAADRELPTGGPGRGGWRPLPRWLLVAVPLGIAVGLACAALLLLIALR